jgi:hypothetical protein
MLICQLLAVVVAWFVTVPASLLWLSHSTNITSHLLFEVERIDPPAGWTLDVLFPSRGQAATTCDSWSSGGCRSKTLKPDAEAWMGHKGEKELELESELEAKTAEEDATEWMDKVDGEFFFCDPRRTTPCFTLLRQLTVSSRRFPSRQRCVATSP